MVSEAVRRRGVTWLTVGAACRQDAFTLLECQPGCVSADQDIDMKQEKHWFYHRVDLSRRNHRLGASDPTNGLKEVVPLQCSPRVGRL